MRVQHNCCAIRWCRARKAQAHTRKAQAHTHSTEPDMKIEYNIIYSVSEKKPTRESERSARRKRSHTTSWSSLLLYRSHSKHKAASSWLKYLHSRRWCAHGKHLPPPATRALCLFCERVCVFVWCSGALVALQISDDVQCPRTFHRNRSATTRLRRRL